MKTLSACIVLTVACLPISETQANGLIQKLPKDGSWVLYHIDADIEKPQGLNYSGTMTIRSVGTEMVEEIPCRWIEIEMTMQLENRKKAGGIFKMLVPEKLFNGDKTVSKKVIRGWVKDRNNNPRKLEDIENYGLFPLTEFLPDPSRKVIRINQKKTIAFQKGELKIDSAITVSVKLPLPENSDFKIDNSLIITIWSHDKVPFGTAEARMEIEVKRDDQTLSKATMTFTLEDFGTGAKSALPDHN